MSKLSKQVDSDSDLSLQLSDASSLTSDSDLSDTQPQKQNKNKKSTTTKKKKKKPVKKTKKKIKDNAQYCTCRRGYDGKEFMIECDGCQEWFHGACVGLKPNSVTDHYFCKSCIKKKPISAGKTLIPPITKKKSIIILPISKPVPKPPSPKIANLSIQDDDEDEDLDDLCIICDGDCTCGPAQVQAPPPPVVVVPPPPPKIEAPKIVFIKKPLPPASKKSKKPKKSTIVKQETSDSSSSDSDSSSSSSEEEEAAPNPVIKAPKKKTVKSTAKRRGKSTTVLANIVRQKALPHASKGGKKIHLVNKLSEDEDDEELVVDDLDDLLETMSPLSDHASNESDNSLLGESEEFFTDDDEEEDEDVNIDSSSLTHSPYPESRTSCSSVHIDSGDDSDIEDIETKAIIADLTLDSDDEMDESDLEEAMFVEDTEDDDDDEIEGNGLSINYHSGNNNWSSDEDDEEEEEFDYTTGFPSEEEGDGMEDSEEDQPLNPLLPLLDSEGNLYDSIAAAFMHSLAPEQKGDITTGANTPILNGEYQLSPFELAHALNALSEETSRQQEFTRRPSLPSSAVSAAHKHRGSQDFSTSEALRALSSLVSDGLELSLEPIDESDEKAMESSSSAPPSPAPLSISTDIISSTPPSANTSPTSHILPTQLALSLSTDVKLQEQILDILKGSTSTTTTNNNNNTTVETTTTQTTKKSSPSLISRQILPKPSGSGVGHSSSASSFFPASLTTASLEQQIQDAIRQSIENNKRKGFMADSLDTSQGSIKKRRLSIGTVVDGTLQPMESTSSFSTPASPAAIIDELEDMSIHMDDQEEEEGTAVNMDDLVDTSQLYTRSLSRSPSPEDDTYSRDLSRWQRIPIGAFRLMRSRNKLWLER